MSVLRYVMSKASFGVKRAGQDAQTPATAPDAAAARVDVDVELVGVDEAGWQVKLKLPEYDLATHNRLCSVQVFLASPADRRVLADGAAYVASQLPASEAVDVSAEQGGGELDVPLPVVPDGDYVGQVVLGFEQ